MKSMHRTLLATALVAGLGVAAVAQTQTAPSATPAAPQAQGDHGRAGPQRMERHRARAEERRAQRLAELKTQLRITGEQEAAWSAWTGALQPGAGVMARPNRAEFAALSTPERIDRMRQLRSQHIAELDKRGDATKAFYGTLSQEQKRVFDAVGMSYLHGGKGGKRGFGGHRHHA